MSTATAQNSNSTAIAKPPSKLATLKGWLEGNDFKQAIARALPKHMTAERFCRIAITAAMKVPLLLDCTQASVFNCLLALSQFGLEPDGRRAHLVPFKVSKQRGGVWVEEYECTLIIDFKGYAELAMRSGLVSNIHADVVCENDQFEYNMGQITKHSIDFRKPRGAAYAAYTVVRMKDGTEAYQVMPKADIYAIRDRSQGWQAFCRSTKKNKQSPWNPAEPIIEYEMWKKTTFRRLTKWITLSAEIRDLEQFEDEQEDRFKDSIQTEGVVIPEGTSKSDAIADMLDRKAIADDMDQSENGHDEMSGDELREQLENANASTESREKVPVSKPAAKKAASTAKTDQPSLLATGIYSSIASAKRREELDRVDDDIREARSRDEITHDESVELRKALKDKLATFAE